MSHIYDRVALIGMGLIASSMFWAMKRGDLAGHVTGFARSEETRETARRIGLCDTVCDTLADAVKDADLIVLAVPVGVMGQARRDAYRCRVGQRPGDRGRLTPCSGWRSLCPGAPLGRHRIFRP